MKDRLTDQEVEEVLAEGATGPLASFIFQMKRTRDNFDHSLVGDAAARASALSPGSHHPIKEKTPMLTTWKSKLAAVGASATLAVGSVAGIAVAADGSNPNDGLYGIDRALENIGIGNGGAAERFAEVESLIAEGDFARGLEHAATVRNENATNGAADALAAAAERVAVNGSEQAPETKAAVSALLTYLSLNIGAVDGHAVADLAHQIGGRPESPGKSADAPGQAGDTGPRFENGGPPDSIPPGRP